jgi:ubiquinone/menaquinone biosynthesis C-methylase UbiE
MSDNDSVFTGSIPEIYDRYLVPLIFEAYADDLAARAAALAPLAVLEIACGTGVVTRALAPRLSADATYDATDLNQAMLDRAAEQQGPDERIIWRQADALALPFADASFDAVVCQFSVMFFPDKAAAYAEALRVLKPGGSFFFNVWDRIENNEFAHAVTDAAALEFPDDPPQFLSRTPHGYHDFETIRADLKRGGFFDVSISTVEETSSAPSPRDAAVAYCQGTPLRGEIESRGLNLLEKVTSKATQVIADRSGAGVVTGKICGHVVTAVSPQSSAF